MRLLAHTSGRRSNPGETPQAWVRGSPLLQAHRVAAFLMKRWKTLSPWLWHCSVIQHMTNTIMSTEYVKTVWCSDVFSRLSKHFHSIAQGSALQMPKITPFGSSSPKYSTPRKDHTAWSRLGTQALSYLLMSSAISTKGQKSLAGNNVCSSPQ